jgi:hypothetical protein
MKNGALLLVTVAWLCGASAIVRGEEKALTGTISDSLCGASHAAMAEKQKSRISDRDCVIACLSYSTENSPKLVVVAKGGQIYQIANQKFAGLIRHAGEALVITGDVSGTTMTITKIEVAAKP